ncbi:MAG: GntR family transcriptional regulator [Clostridia bacterium]|nr:GntR family transcriptional regulator [Clostridia bacterium]
MKNSSKMPMYKSMYRSIREKIEKELYPVGMLLPNEEELQQEYSASRTTVRHAIALLKEDGFIEVRQGYGTEVVRRKISQSLNSITSVSETLRKMGNDVGVGHMHIERIYATYELANELKIEVGEPIIQISRIQTANDEPITIAKNYIPEKFVPGLVEESENIVSLYKYLEEKYGLRITKVEDRIGAASASFDEAVALRIESKSALVVVRRVCYMNETPFEVDYVKIIASKYEYRNDFEAKE